MLMLSCLAKLRARHVPATASGCRSLVFAAERASFGEPRGLILVDLENVDSIKESLGAWHDQCRLVEVQLRTYTCDSNGLASLATDHVRSGMKDAVDFQISHVDAATFIQANVGSGAKVLIVTNDDFGETVASMSKDIAAAKLNILCFLLPGKRRCELNSSRKHRIGQARGHLIRS